MSGPQGAETERLQRLIEFMVQETLDTPDEIILAEEAARVMSKAFVTTVSDPTHLTGRYYISFAYKTMDEMHQAYEFLGLFTRHFLGDKIAKTKATPSTPESQEVES